MAFDIYSASVPVAVHALKCLKHVVRKGHAHLAEGGMSETDFLGLALADDMFGLGRQIQIATDNAKGMASRLGGAENPSYPDDETTVEALMSRIDKTIAFCTSIDAAAFAGAEDRDVVLKIGKMELPFTGQSYLLTFALPNFYFHVTTAYGILRQAGVPLSKSDYLRGG